jgi:hypothetical protein
MYRAPREQQARGGRNEWIDTGSECGEEATNEGIEDESR